MTTDHIRRIKLKLQTQCSCHAIVSIDDICTLCEAYLISFHLKASEFATNCIQSIRERFVHRNKSLGIHKTNSAYNQ